MKTFHHGRIFYRWSGLGWSLLLCSLLLPGLSGAETGSGGHEADGNDSALKSFQNSHTDGGEERFSSSPSASKILRAPKPVPFPRNQKVRVPLPEMPEVVDPVQKTVPVVRPVPPVAAEKHVTALPVAERKVVLVKPAKDS